MDVDTSEILYDIEIDENLLDVAQEIDHQKQEAIRYAGRKGKENIYYVNVAKVREDENEWKEFKSRYSINSTPTFTVYREGSIEKTVFWTKESGMSLAEVEEFLDYVSMQQ